MQFWSELPHALPGRKVELVEGMIGLGEQTAYFTVTYDGIAVGTAGFWQSNEVGYILHPRLWTQELAGKKFRREVSAGHIFDAHPVITCCSNAFKLGEGGASDGKLQILYIDPRGTPS